MSDPVHGGLVVETHGKRLTLEEAAVVREAMANGVAVQFQNRHQWRHFQRNP